MIYYDEPHLTLRWEPDDKIVCAQWKNDVRSEPMRAGLEAGLKLIAEKKARRWLVDSRELGAIDPADVKWVNDNWIPRAVDAGIAWMAFVMAKKIVMQMTMKTFIARINQRELGTAYFEDLDGARTWLRDQS
jgi:hypothetical protein